MPPTLPPEAIAAAVAAYRRAETAARDSTISSAAAETTAREVLLINRQLRASEWVPYPWQHPHTHPDDWAGPCTPDCLTRSTVGVPTHGSWLLLGGRGTGKSDGAARYVAAHVTGPPCDTRLTGGHKMIMVAPTQGDAVEVINGPSGLTTVAPGAALVGGAGGLSVRFQNGARMRVLGAYTPDDENRLRSAGNNSLPAGTLITTETGDRPIEFVRVGDRVWTHAGLRPVTAEWDHGTKPLVTLTTDTGRVLRATADHEVWTLDGWVNAGDLLCGTRIVTWNTAVTVGRRSARTTPAASSETAGGRRCSSTASSMRSTTGRSRTAGTSTTGTTTRATTTPPTLKLYPLGSTAPNTPTTRSGTGRAGWPRSAGTLPASVSTAERRSEAGGQPAGSAPVSAGVLTRPLSLPPTDCGHASCVAASSPLPPTPSPSLAVERVVTVSRGSIAVPVYDLTVAGEHAFFANGVLVANCLVYLEEAAAMRHLGPALTHTGLGLRVGSNPHYIIATTPKPRPEVKALIEDPLTVRTWGTTDQAIHLDPAVRAMLERKHGGTRLGRQELGGELLGDVEGALWVHEQDYTDPNDVRPGIENDRVPAGTVVTTGAPGDSAPGVRVVHRAVVSVDPNQGGRDEAGIGVVGAIGDHAYVLADLSGRMTSDQWARRAVQAHFDYETEGIVLEKSGGDNPTLILRSVVLEDGRRGDQVPVFYAPTKVGKRLRAEPVAAIYEQHRIHHVGVFPELEEQQTSWIPDETVDSPDRVDWLVHGITHLLIRTHAAQVASPAGVAAPGPRGGFVPPGRVGTGRIR